MFKLIKNEHAKFGNSYINYLSFFAMLLPLVLSISVWYLRKESFTAKDMYNWGGLINSLQLFYSIFLGTIIPSFIAVFSVYYEIQEKTLKNLLTMPYNRMQILLSKIIYSCMVIISINLVIWIITVIFGLLLGFDSSIGIVFSETMELFLPSLATLAIVPVMIFLTICFKNFMFGMILTVVCSVMNFAFLNKENAYLFPWSISSNLYLLLAGRVSTNPVYPAISALIIFTVFLFLSLSAFKKMDVNV